MQTDIRRLLQSAGDKVTESDKIQVLTAQCQPYDPAMNYKVVLDISTYHHIQIKYTIGGVVNNTKPKPSDLTLVDAGYQDVEDLSSVEGYVHSLDTDIRSLVSSNSDIDITDTSNICVISAIVRTNNNYVYFDRLIEYSVTMNVGPYNDIIISFEIDDNNNGVNLKLIDSGYKSIDDSLYIAVNDIQNDVRLDIVRIEGDIRKLVNASLSDDIIAVNALSQDIDNGWKCYYRVTLNVGSRTGVIIEYFKSIPIYDIRYSLGMPEHLRLIDRGILAGAFQNVDDLTQIQEHIARADAEIRWLLKVHGVENIEDDDIIVRYAQQQAMIGMEYRVTFDVGCYIDVVIEYFIDLIQNDPKQKPTNLHLIDAGDCYHDALQSAGYSESVSQPTVVIVIIVSSILGLCLIGFVVVCAVYLCRNKKRRDTNALYGKLTADANL